MLTYPLFLIGLSAVALPIIIHLLQLRRYRKVYFSNVEMLQELQNEDRRQHKLRQWLVLALRILAIVCIVLAFCQPVVPGTAGKQKAGGTAVSVYVDNSYSMANGGMGGSLIEAARHKAAEIAAAYKPGDHFQLITNEGDGSQFRWLSREEFLQAVEQIEVCAVTTPLSNISKRQNEFLLSAPENNRHAYIVSDFQCSTADLANCTADSNILTTMIPLGGSEVANIYIDSLFFESPAYFKGSTVNARVTVRNNGDKPVEALPLRLIADGKQKAIASVNVAAHGSSTAEMNFTLADDGLLQGYVETTDYPITFDDRMFFTLSATQRIPVLVVSGGEENKNIKRLFEDDPLVIYEQVASTRIDYSGIVQHKLIILDELHSIPSGLAQTMLQFVEEGGSVLIIPAMDCETESYNQMLQSCHAPQIGQTIRNKTRVSTVHLQHDLFRGVFEGQQEDMELPSVNAYHNIVKTLQTVSFDIMSLTDGTSYLSSTTYGEGQIYLVASPLRSDNSDFVQQALFVPTVYNMALFSTPYSTPYHLLTGSVPINLRGRIATGVCRVVPASSANGDAAAEGYIPDIRHVGSRSMLLPHGELSEAGNYLLLSSQPIDGETNQTVDGYYVAEGLSFNYSRAESDLAYYSLDELRHIIDDADMENCRVVNNPQRSMTDYIQQQNHGRPLWHWFLIAALAALLAETIILIRKD